MRLLYSKLFLAITVLGIPACADDSPTTETGPSTPPPMFISGTRPEGELFGSFYNNGTRISGGSPFYIELVPLDAATQSRLHGFSGEQTATILGVKADYGWYDPIASDGPCSQVGTIGHADHVSFYLSGGRSNPDGTPTDPAYAEIHTADWNPSNSVDGHCIRPGRYSLEIVGQGATSGTIPVDYIAYETIPGYGPGIQITQTDRPFPAYLESDAYSSSDTYDDLVVHFDKTPQPSAKRVPEIAYDVQAAYSTSTFSPGTATAEVGSVVRIRTMVASPVGSANSYIVRNWWDYGTMPGASGGFYTAGDSGRFLRWKAVAGSSDRCLILGADAKHMSNPIESAPTSYVRIGVGRACYGGQDLVIGAVATGWNGTTVAPQVKISNVTGTAYSGSATATVYLSTDQDLGDDLFLGSQAISLNVGAAATQSVTLSGLSVPSTGATYYVFVVLSGVTGENEVSNNTMWDPISFVAPAPPPQADFRIDSVTSAASFAPGASGPVKVFVKNVGAAAAAPSSIKVYLSSDNVIGGTDSVIGVISDISSLGVNSVRAESLWVTVPATHATGNFYLLARVDANGAVTESNESNNDGARSGTVSVTSLPDLETTIIKSYGEMFTGTTDTIVTVGVFNRGNATAAAGWTMSVYLSADSTGGTILALLGSTTISTSLAPSAWIIHTNNRLVAPVPCFATGLYYLRIELDSGGAITESDEADNVRVVGPVQLTRNNGCTIEPL